MPMDDFKDLHAQVIARGLCTACGLCVGACPHECLQWDDELEEPRLDGECLGCGLCASACPGGGAPLPVLEEKFLGRSRTPEEEYLGVHQELLCGHARDESLRRASASGGVTSALLIYAMEQGLIDAAVLAGSDPERPWRTIPILARSPEEVRAAVGSRYQLCPSLAALGQAATWERVAVVALPCQVHGLRKLAASPQGRDLRERVVFILGLFCGANTSYRITEHVIAEFSDVPLHEIRGFTYRGGPSSHDITIKCADGSVHTIANADRISNYLWLIRDRCRMCPDWTAELADVSLGDIFVGGAKGPLQKVPHWNGFIVRNDKGRELVAGAQKAGAISLEPLEEAALYGNIGFEAKKHGAIHHLHQRKRYGWPTPDFGCEFSWRPRRRVPFQISLPDWPDPKTGS
ncbi:Coenzyme F420 hydrogenase/dehydrogenase, beta subunit C-terminal domain [Desulfoferula mesophila]|uniref:Coenzyme F420-reducing hydrogenase subunit beta-like protein n=1 Tax=Desulfoferula mesophila TaxID=3058419 RepID=A0AAU9ED09_9BACT|nr:coenzyme F420-reducing hydrogenase subunit beta-like protein [Desulfoferula mesophilus]